MVYNKRMISMLALSLLAMPAMVLAKVNLDAVYELGDHSTNAEIVRLKKYIAKDWLDKKKFKAGEEEKYTNFIKQRIALLALEEAMLAENNKKDTANWATLKTLLEADAATKDDKRTDKDLVIAKAEEVKKGYKEAIEKYKDEHRSALGGAGFGVSGLVLGAGAAWAAAKGAMLGHNALGGNVLKTAAIVVGVPVVLGVVALAAKPAWTLTKWTFGGIWSGLCWGGRLAKTCGQGIACAADATIGESLRYLDGVARNCGVYKVRRTVCTKMEEIKKEQEKRDAKSV